MDHQGGTSIDDILQRRRDRQKDRKVQSTSTFGKRLMRAALDGSEFIGPSDPSSLSLRAPILTSISAHTISAMGGNDSGTRWPLTTSVINDEVYPGNRGIDEFAAINDPLIS